MNRVIPIFISLTILFSCNKEVIIQENENLEFVSAVDISSYPEMSNTNLIFFDTNGNQSDFLTILKENGINTIRLRLWVNPSNSHSGFNEVKQFSHTLKTKGFRIWLTVHYSDTWADPSQQQVPLTWQGADFNALKDSIGSYTKKVVSEIKPDYIQIGNEINLGFLHPYGHIVNNNQNFLELMSKAITAVRQNSIDTKIIIHFAGIDHSDWFFNQVKYLDYDIIGLSYYPIWHGKSLLNLKTKMQLLSETYNKKILIAETAYPFTLGWNDWTNNIVGLNDQLILPDYPPTIQGQMDFVKNIRTLTKEIPNGIGFCYWGAELVAWKGNQATDGSSWENQALFDFQNRALPALKEFRLN